MAKADPISIAHLAVWKMANAHWVSYSLALHRLQHAMVVMSTIDTASQW